MLSRIGLRVAVLGLLVAVFAAAPAVAAPAVDGEFTVSGLDANNKLTQGPDGNIWVTLDDATNEVARITPTGEVTEYDLAGVNDPSGIVAGPEKSHLWLTYEGGVASFSPAAADPAATVDATALAQVAGEFHSIVAGPDGNLWVAASEVLLRFAPADPGNPDVFAVSELAPRDIDVAGQQLAIADFGGKIVTATTDGATTPFPIAGGSQGVAGGPGGQIAFTQQAPAATEFGLLTPPGSPTTFPSPETDPFGVAFGSDRAYWIAQFATDSLTRLTPGGGSTALGGFTAKGGPRQIAAGPGDTLWVTLEDPVDDPDKVARVSGVVPESEPVCFCGLLRSLRTRIVKGPKRKVKISGRRALVRFRFRSPDKGVKFECALTKIRKGAVPRRRFRDCKPPQIYALRPGKYRFWVRAVRGEEFDRTPAKRTFFVIRKR